MFQLGKTIVSEDLLKKEFVCNISSCKDSCCIDGDSGAPLEKEETQIGEDIYSKIKPFLRKQGIDAIKKQGSWVKNDFDELETPLHRGCGLCLCIFGGKGGQLHAPLKKHITKELLTEKNLFLAIYIL